MTRIDQTKSHQILREIASNFNIAIADNQSPWVILNVGINLKKSDTSDLVYICSILLHACLSLSIVGLMPETAADFEIVKNFMISSIHVEDIPCEIQKFFMAFFCYFIMNGIQLPKIFYTDENLNSKFWDKMYCFFDKEKSKDSFFKVASKLLTMDFLPHKKIQRDLTGNCNIEIELDGGVFAQSRLKEFWHIPQPYEINY